MKNATLAWLLAAAVALSSGCQQSEEDETSPFIVISVVPSDNQTNIPVQSSVTLRFTHPVDHATVVGTKQVILVDQQNSIVPISFQVKGELVILTPGSPLATNATYGVAVRPGVRDIYGSLIDVPFEATFSTGQAVASIPNWPPFTLAPAGGPMRLGPPGTFTPVGALFIPRARHTAERLKDGRVIAIGGESVANFGAVERSAEIWDPATLQWTLSQSNNGLGMYHERVGHTSTMLNNGRILVTGGTNNGLQAFDNAEIYDPINDQFYSVLAPMNRPRMFHTATLMGNGNVFLAGGATTSIQNPIVGTILTDALEVYDVNSGGFYLCSATLTPTFVQGDGGRIYHKSVVLPDQSILITGGLGFIGQPSTTRLLQNYVPDLSGIGFNGTLAIYANRLLNIFRCEHTVNIITEGDAAGLVVVIGGMRTTASYGNGEVYDHYAASPNSSATGLCQYLASNMFQARRSHTTNYIPASAYADRTNPWGKLLVVGGCTQLGTIGQTPPYPPHAWPFIEPAGCTCNTTTQAEIFDPFSFGKNAYLPFKGVDQTGQFVFTQDPQGNQTFVPNYFQGLYWHTATNLTDNSVLITGGMDCPFFCLFGPVEGVPMPFACVYNP